MEGGYDGGGNEADIENARRVLEVSRDASFEEVRKKYLQLVKKMHPDKGGSREAFSTIQEAYELLESRLK